jgi:poly(3-hydroxybutyrate) depolymerase
VNLLAGANDHITPPDQVFALADAVSTPADRITRHTTSGGHLGLFMGTEALRDHWPVVMASVLEHSRPRADGAPARGRARSRTAPARASPAP